MTPVWAAALIALGASGQVSTNGHVLPAAAVERTSVVQNTPDALVTLDEGGRVPSDPQATCDGKADVAFLSSAGAHVEHYFPASKAIFDQTIAMRRRYISVKTVLEPEVGTSPIVLETLDGAEAAFAIVTTPCIAGIRPASTQIKYYVRLIGGTTYADISVTIFAIRPDAARAYAREMMRMIGSVNYASIK